MKSSRRVFVILMLVSLMFCVYTSALDQKRVLFYEKNSKYKIDKDYSMFKEALERKGYIVESLNIELSREVLRSRNPDVLVIASLTKSLSSNELASIFEFVMQDGKGLFVLGGSGKSGKTTSPANQITIPFGMTMDSAMLEDEKNPVIEDSKPSTKKNNFVVSLFNKEDPTIRLAISGISQVAFFDGPGIIVPEKADTSVKIVARGSRNAYSPGSSVFQKGSQPPIATAAIVGNGLVFVLSDEDMLTNKYLDTSKYKYDNLRFGTNIIDWLYSTKPSLNVSRDIDQLRVVYGECMVDVEKLTDNVKKLTNKTKELQKNLEITLNQKNELQEKLKRLESQSDPVLGINYMYWAIAVLGVAIIILSLVMAGKKAKKELKEEGGEVFGYEFEESFEGEEEGKEGEEDIDNITENMDKEK